MYLPLVTHGCGGSGFTCVCLCCRRDGRLHARGPHRRAGGEAAQGRRRLGEFRAPRSGGILGNQGTRIRGKPGTGEGGRVRGGRQGPGREAGRVRGGRQGPGREAGSGEGCRVLGGRQGLGREAGSCEGGRVRGGRQGPGREAGSGEGCRVLGGRQGPAREAGSWEGAGSGGTRDRESGGREPGVGEGIRVTSLSECHVPLPDALRIEQCFSEGGDGQTLMGP